MNKHQLLTVGLAAMFGFLIACATRAAMPTTTAQALPPVENQYTECVALSLWLGSGSSFNDNGELPRAVRVPQGWTVVGGGPRAQMNEGMMVVCH